MSEPQRRQNAVNLVAPIMLVKTCRPGPDPKVAQQPPGNPGVLGGHQRDLPQDAGRPGRQVPQIPDGRAYYI